LILDRFFFIFDENSASWVNIETITFFNRISLRIRHYNNKTPGKTVLQRFRVFRDKSFYFARLSL